VTAEKLRARGIQRLVDVRTFDDQALRQAVGSMAEWLKQLAHGIDERPVVAHRETKSSGSENTYPEDLIDIDTIREEIAEMAQRAVAWLERRALLARTVHDKSPLSRISPPSRAAIHLRESGCRRSVDKSLQLLQKTAVGQRPVRTAWS
jgi:DNA polymerase-4